MSTLTSHLSIIPESARVQIEPTANGIHVSVPANEHVALVEKFQSNQAEAYTTQTRVSVSVAPGAQVTHYKLVLEGVQAIHQSFLEAEVEKDAAFQTHVFLMSGAQIRNTIQVRLKGENAPCVL